MLAHELERNWVLLLKRTHADGADARYRRISRDIQSVLKSGIIETSAAA